MNVLRHCSPAICATSIAVFMAAGSVISPTSQAATSIKQNNTITLDLAGSWDVLPGVADVGLWDSTVTGANSVGIGAGLSLGAIQVTNPGGLVNINGSSALTLNGATINGVANVGIDLSAAFQDLTIDTPITLGATQSWVAGAGRVLTVNNAISGGTNGLTFQGLGQTVLAGAASSTYTGATTVNGSSLKLDFANLPTPTNLLAPTSALLLGGGKLTINGSVTGATSQTFASTGFTTGSNSISVINNGSSATVALGALTVTKGASVNFSTTGTITTTTAGGTGTNQFGVLGNIGNATGNTPGYATVGLFDWASTNVAAGTAGTSPYTILPLSAVTGGYVAAPNGVGQGANVDLQANLTVAANTGASTIRFNTPAANTINNGNRYLVVGGYLITPNMGATNATLMGASSWFAYYSNAAGSVQNGYVWQNNILGYFNIACNIGNGRDATLPNAPLTYVQSGAGTVAITGNGVGHNAYAGQTYLNGGSTLITGNVSLGNPSTGATVNLNGGTAVANATFTMDNAGVNQRPFVLGGNGGGLAATAGNVVTVNGLVSGAPGTGSLTIGIPASSANQNTQGLLPGSGSIAGGQMVDTANPTAVFATGTVILSGANTYTGGTTLESGAVQISGINNLGGSGTYGGVTFNGGTLKYAPSASGAGSLDVSSGRGLTLTPAGAKIDTNGNAVTFATAFKANGGSGGLTVNDTAVTKGTLTLGGANTYTGATNVNAGTLALAAGSSLANTAISVSTGATFLTQPGAGNIQIGSAGGSLSLASGAFFSMADAAIGTTTLNTVGAGSGTVLTLADAGFTFDLASAGADRLIANNGGISLSGTNNITLSAFGAVAPGSLTGITLLSVPNGTLSLGNFSLVTTAVSFGANSYTASLSLGGGNTQLQLNLATLVTAPFYWTGATNGLWSTAGNFATSRTGATPQSSGLGSTSDVYETADAAGNFNQTVGTSVINSLSFRGTGTAAASNAVNLGGGTLTLNAGAAFTDPVSNITYPGGTGLVVQSGSAAHVISADVVLGASQTWEIDNAPVNALTVSGNVTGSGKILTKTGLGKLILAGAANSYASTVVSGGTLAAGAAFVLPSTAPLTVQGAGSTFDLAGFDQSVATLADGGVATGTVTSSSGTPTLFIGNSAANSYSGSISGSLSATLNGSSAVTFSGANTYTGLTTLSSGSLVAASDSALGSSISPTGGLLLNPSAGTVIANFTSATPAIASLASSGAGTSSVVLGNPSGAGSTTTLSVGAGGATTTFGGVISDATATNPAAIGNLSVMGGNLTLGAANTFKGTTMIAGGILTLGNPLALQNSALDYNNQGGTLSFGTQTAATLAAFNGAQSLALTNEAAAAVALTVGTNNSTSIFTGLLNGLGSFLKIGIGTVSLVGAGGTGGATYVGGTTIDAGTLILGGASNLTGTVAVKGVGAAANLIVQDSAVINSTTALFVGQGTAGTTGSSVLVKGNASVTASSFDFGNGVALSQNSSLTIQDSGIVTINGAFNLNHTAGSSGSSNTVNLNGGTLAVNSFTQSSLGTNNQNGIIRFNGGTLKALVSDGTAVFLPAPGANPARTTTFVDAGGAKIDSNGFNITIANPLVVGTGAPAGGLTKSGLGTLTLTGANTYTGATVINAGTLQLGDGTTGHDGTIAGSASIVNNAALAYNRFGTTLTYGGVISGPGTVQKLGAGSQTLTGINTYTGATSVDGGPLLINGSIAFSATTVNTGGTLGGTGTTGSVTVASGGVLSPGNSPGILNTGVVDLQSGSSLTLELGGTTAGNLSTNHDQLNVSGSVTLAGAANITLFGAYAGTAAVNDTFMVILIDGFNGPVGIFSNDIAGQITGTDGSVYGVSYTAGDGNDVQLRLLTVVPEPGVAVSLVGGLGLLVGLRRRRQSI